MAQLIVHLKDRELGRHPVGAQTRIGRDASCEVVIDNVGVSRLHAIIAWDGQRYQVIDEHSQNGVFLNGHKVTNQYLNDGDVIQIGKFSLRFEQGQVGAAPPVLTRRGVPPAPGSREIQKTLALGPDDVRKLMNSHSQPPEPIAPALGMHATQVEEGQDNTVKILVFGLMGVALVGVIGYFLLIH